MFFLFKKLKTITLDQCNSWSFFQFFPFRHRVVFRGILEGMSMLDKCKKQRRTLCTTPALLKWNTIHEAIWAKYSRRFLIKCVDWSYTPTKSIVITGAKRERALSGKRETSVGPKLTELFFRVIIVSLFLISECKGSMRRRWISRTVLCFYNAVINLGCCCVKYLNNW